MSYFIDDHGGITFLTTLGCTSCISCKTYGINRELLSCLRERSQVSEVIHVESHVDIFKRIA